MTPPAGAPGPGTDLAPGRLLVATPMLVDPNFDHTIVLVLDVDEDGALGVVLNRPSPVPVHEVLPGWDEILIPPHVLFQGGPVGTDSALAVADLRDGADGEDPVGFRRLFGDTGIVDLDAPTEIMAPALRRLRVFAGYAGWGGGQLEAEIEEGSWYVVPMEPGDLYATDPDRLWSRVLRRQPGELAWVSTRPVDPTLN
ncbi:MAG TPA: YqgE/AlgH family protein [Nocardioides sp.]|nr:YqgE/AlgH family protein [uncultured Nocardioides sp.]HEX5987097.1 YqgE/AlgH family protein [Nocardioides sp.]